MSVSMSVSESVSGVLPMTHCDEANALHVSITCVVDADCRGAYNMFECSGMSKRCTKSEVNCVASANALRDESVIKVDDTSSTNLMMDKEPRKQMQLVHEIPRQYCTWSV